MPAFLTCAFVLCAYLMSIQVLASSRYTRVSLPRLAALLAPFALVVLAIVAVCSFSLGSWDDMLMLLAVLLPPAAVVIGVHSIKSRLNDLNICMVVLFVMSLLAVGYVTLFSRDGSTSTRVLFELRNITRALKTGSLLYLKHLIMNVILFMPFGFLLCASCPERCNRLLTVFTYALLFSCAIESLQYLLVIGECDLEDVLGNVLGAWAGLGVFRLYLRTQ